MPEYLAPGVYVEEVSFRSKSIEGVSTTTTGFIGPTTFGPLDLEPDIITSLGEYELIYGSGDQLVFEGDVPSHNYMWHAVRAFFTEGGKRLYVTRVYAPKDAAKAKLFAFRTPVKDGDPDPDDLKARAEATGLAFVTVWADEAQKLADAAKAIVVPAQKAADDAKQPAADAQKAAADAQKAADDTKKVADDTQKASDDAKKASDDAKKAVDDAKQPAADAQKAADDAKKVADDTQKAADDAKKASDDAKKAVDDAKQPAADAQKAADDAKAAADQAVAANAPDKDAKLADAAAKAAAAKAKADDLKAKTDDAAAKAAAAKAKADDLKAKTDDAAAKAAAAKAKADDLKAKTDDAAAKAAAAKAKADDVRAKVSDAKTKAADTKTKAADAKTKTTDADMKAKNAEAKTANANALQADADVKAAHTAGLPFTIWSRFAGRAGDAKVLIGLRVGQNVLANDNGKVKFVGLQDNDLVYFADSDDAHSGVYTASFDPLAKPENAWTFTNHDNGDAATNKLDITTIEPVGADGKVKDRMVILTLTVSVITPNGNTYVYDPLPPHPQHKRGSQPDSFFDYFGRTENQTNLAQARSLPIVIVNELDAGAALQGQQLLDLLFGDVPAKVTALLGEDQTPIAPVTFMLDGGSDGSQPGVGEYGGEEVLNTTRKTGLMQFLDIEDISIVAAPGSSAGYITDPRRALSIMNLLLGHARDMRYRIAVLDSGDKMTIGQVRELRAQLDSTYGALYYPWVRIFDPITRQQIHLPPSGFMAGIYARNDIRRAVYKAPANEVITLSIGFETMINKAQQEVMNPEGINCLRFFEGRGYLVWGARTVSSDPEWKYVNLRRYFAYLERSIDRGTQWAVFEPNGEQLWANVRRTIEDFLLNEWQNGALLGDKPEKAFFVRCDRSTMTQNDLDNGRLICLIGVAPLRPAEFVIFRIGQWTSDRKV